MPGPVDLRGILGLQPADIAYVPDTTQRFPLGYVTDFNDPYYGWQKMIYAQAAAAQETGSLVFFTNAWVATDIPNTANTGLSIGVAKTAMAINTYGWYILSGQAPWSATASVAAGVAFGITAAGQVGANTAGKQILGARVNIAGTGTFTRTVQTFSGSTRFVTSSCDGLFIGLAISGTGIAGSSTIATIDPSSNTFTTNNAATANGTVTATYTYTNFLIVYANSPFVQGAIT